MRLVVTPIPKNSMEKYLLSNEILRKHVSSSQYASRIERFLQLSHLTQVLIPIKLAQVFAFEFADAMLRGNRSADFDCAANKGPVNLARLHRFVVVARQDIDVDVVVADVAKDRVAKISATQTILIK